MMKMKYCYFKFRMSILAHSKINLYVNHTHPNGAYIYEDRIIIKIGVGERDRSISCPKYNSNLVDLVKFDLDTCWGLCIIYCISCETYTGVDPQGPQGYIFLAC